MTSKIEVPRELLVVLADLNCPYDQLMAAKQRAAELLAAPEAPRQSGCCCPPKGHAGIWAAAMCPVHHGLRAMIDRNKSESGAPLSPDHSGGEGKLVLPSVDEVMKLVLDYQYNIRTNVTGTTNWAANLGMHIIDKVKELNK